MPFVVGFLRHCGARSVQKHLVDYPISRLHAATMQAAKAWMRRLPALDYRNAVRSRRVGARGNGAIDIPGFLTEICNFDIIKCNFNIIEVTV